MSYPHRRVHHFAFAVGVLLTASLTGCAGSALPTPTDSAAGEAPSASGPSSAPSADPDATDLPDDPADPGGPVAQSGPQPASVLPLACRDLASLAQVQAGFHATVAATITQDSPPPNASRVDFVQAGGLYCAWTGSGGTGLQLGVIPGAASNYAQRVAGLTGSGFHDDSLGDDSHVKCTIDGGSARCVGD